MTPRDMTQRELFDARSLDDARNDAMKHAAVERDERERILGALEGVRAELVEVGKRTAQQLSVWGPVTSVAVFAAMRAAGYGHMMDQVDSRWAGCLFRRGWRRVGYEPIGSHCRPVAMWERAS